MNQTSYIGNDGWDAIAQFLDDQDVRSVLLVTGRSSYTSSGAEAGLGGVLKGKRVRRVSDFDTNPKGKDIRRILSSVLNDEPYDIIIAVGGGSVLDVAKLLKAFWSSENPVIGNLYHEEPLVPDDIPLIAIPSTAGSGSEATHFAVVYEGKKKFSIAHEAILPNFSVIIPSLLASLPRSVAAASGMDALCQAIESYWSIFSTEESQKIAAEAISLAWKSLEKAVLSRAPHALEEMAKASHLAGKAINITKTTAPHAVSYALTSFYGLQHGHAVGLLVPEFLKYNAAVTEDDCLDHRGKGWVQEQLMDISHRLGCPNIESASDALKSKLRAIGLGTSLDVIGVKSNEDIDRLVENGFNPQRVNNNPRRLTEAELRKLLRNLM
ncbi:MAG: phosphonoacetaldehyde reductase [Verrucomicrobiae bacterium]|nr:phosphonoacetaldehyde reductase [Verrucomicrobiae bacterium]NNJ42534.1 phosphonoacetaldehyde reductase [Akkermansiaceae bacterium]